MLLPSAPRVVDFLHGSMVALVATVSATDRPFVTPLWFVVDGGTLYLTTGTATWAARNVARQPASPPPLRRCQHARYTEYHRGGRRTTVHGGA